MNGTQVAMSSQAVFGALPTTAFPQDSQLIGPLPGAISFITLAAAQQNMLRNLDLFVPLDRQY